MKKLIDYGVIKNPEPEIETLIEIAGNFSNEFDQQEKTQVDLDDSAKTALKILSETLGKEEEPEDIQNTIYQIAKSNDVQPKDFFKILYQIILGNIKRAKDRTIHFRYWKKASSKNTFRVHVIMVHGEHNRSRNSGGFALIILGALLLFLAPNIHPSMPELGTMSLIGGLIIGGIGFYLKFIRTRVKQQ